LNDGTVSFTWDQSNVYRNTMITHKSYPACKNDAGTIVNCDDSTIKFSPYNNRPLHIVWCNYSTEFEPRATCNASSPMLVQAKVAPPGESGDTCDGYCFLSEFESSGMHEMFWYGYSIGGVFVGGTPGLLFMRRDDTFPKNLAIAYGTAPAITGISVSPAVFDPFYRKQTIAVDVTMMAGRSVTLTATCRNMASGSILRVLTGSAGTQTHRTLEWDGRADNNEFVAPGTYEITVTVTDSAGSTAVVKPISTVLY
jgi:hypothetical protein